MQSYFRRIESSFILNVPLFANTMSTQPIEDDPYFQTNHAMELRNALSIYIKYIRLQGYQVIPTDKGVPFYMEGTHLFYTDQSIKAFLMGWLELGMVDRTFYTIEMEKKYDEAVRMACTHDQYYLDQLFKSL